MTVDEFATPPPSVPSVSTPAVGGVAVLTIGEWVPLRRPSFAELMRQLAEGDDE